MINKSVLYKLGYLISVFETDNKPYLLLTEHEKNQLFMCTHQNISIPSTHRFSKTALG